MLKILAAFAVLSLAPGELSAAPVPTTWAQAYAACLAAGVLHGYHLPHLCGCVSTAVVAARPADTAAAEKIGIAAAHRCYSSTGLT